MIRSENFIYFISVSGFFLGLIFAVFQGFEPFDFFVAVMCVFFAFYIIAYASVGFFIKYMPPKKLFNLNHRELERTFDLQLDELETKEDLIREAHEFIKQIEQEELELFREESKSK